MWCGEVMGAGTGHHGREAGPEKDLESSEGTQRFMELVFDGEHLAVYAAVAGASAGPVFITFAPREDFPPGKPWGANFFASRGLAVISFVNKQNAWWHTPEMRLAVASIASLVDGRKKILYGNSMGGYAVVH